MTHSQRVFKRHRRLLVLTTLTAAGAVVLAGCSSGSDNSASGSTGGGSGGSCPASNKNKTLHVAFVAATTSQNPMQEMAYGAKEAAKQDGNTKIQVLAPSDVDASKEVQMLESATRTATDGIAWESVSPDSFVRPLQDVKKAGIPLVAVDNMTPKGVTPDLLVSNSNFDDGAKLGKAFVAQNPDPKGTVVIGNDIPTLDVLKSRISGLEHVIKKHYPHMKIVGPFNAQGAGGLTQNEQAWSAEIHSHPKATAFLGVGGPDGISLPLIKKKTNGDWLAGSADIAKQALEAVKDGRLFALSSPEHFMKGYIAIHEIIKQDRTCKTMPHGWWDSGSLLITKKNVDDIIKRQQNGKTRLAWFMKHSIPDQLADPPMKPFDKVN